MPDASHPTSAPEFTRPEIVATIILALAMLGSMFWYYRVHSRPASVEVVRANGGRPTAAIARDDKLDINRAEWQHFALLPRIGEKLGRRIVEFRVANGPFESVDDLSRVPGIGQTVIDAIRPFVKVAEPSTESVKGAPDSAAH